MKAFISISALLLAAFIPATDACRQKYTEYIRTKPCAVPVSDISQECRDIATDLRNHGNAHGKIYGGVISSEAKCQTCDNTGNSGCSCTISAWRFREWMKEPPLNQRPAVAHGWELVDPENGNYGWIDREKEGTVNCD